MRIIFAACALVLAPFSAVAQSAPAESVTIEHYYRIKWGSAGEFGRLYKANHEPLLEEMRRQGFILAMRTDEPFTHMAGNQRWDLRVTITYRDAPSAVVVRGAWDKAYDAAKARLYPNKAKLDAEEARRFSLLEEHWDVIVVSAAD
jgi:hypothetical protein